MKLTDINSDSLIALELLICKVGRRWKQHMRDLKSVPVHENRLGVFALKLKGFTDFEITDLDAISPKFIKRVTRYMIFDELKKRRLEGLKK